MVRLVPITGAPLPTLSDALDSLTVLPVAAGSSGSKAGPSSGSTWAAGSNSARLSSLNGRASARPSVASAFDSRASDKSGRGFAGPPDDGRDLPAEPADCFSERGALDMSTPAERGIGRSSRRALQDGGRIYCAGLESLPRGTSMCDQ